MFDEKTMLLTAGQVRKKFTQLVLDEQEARTIYLRQKLIGLTVLEPNGKSVR